MFEDQNLETEYRPDNDNSKYRGPTRLRVALYRSINLVSIRLLLDIEAGTVLDYVPRFGFDTRDFPRNTQLAIGGGTMAVTPLQMASAYAMLANGGYAVEPHIISRVRDIEGNTIFEARPPTVCRDCAELEGAGPPAALDAAEPATLEALLDDTNGEPATLEDLLADDAVPLEPAEQRIDERVAFLMTTMLRDVIRRGTGFRAWQALGRADLAGKTGTTNDAADTWFNGYNADLAVTVWVGFSNHEPLGARAYGSNIPLPIWIDFMREALDGVPEQPLVQPSGIVSMRIDPTTGEAAFPDQANAVFEYFLREHAPVLPERSTTVQPGADEIVPVDLF